RRLPVDGVINGAPVAPTLKYDVPSGAELWLGIQYQIVRDAFVQQSPHVVRSVVERMIVLAGGGDPLKVLEPVAGCVWRTVGNVSPPIRVDLICGPYADVPHFDGQRGVSILRHPPDLAARMADADLAVSAGGQTLYELARCGTPTVAFCLGPDQAYN